MNWLLALSLFGTCNADATRDAGREQQEWVVSGIQVAEGTRGMPPQLFEGTRGMPPQLFEGTRGMPPQLFEGTRGMPPQLFEGTRGMPPQLAGASQA